MKTADWEQIENDFIDWDEKGHYRASQRQILDWFKSRLESYASQFSGKDLIEKQDELIEHYTHAYRPCNASISSGYTPTKAKNITRNLKSEISALREAKDEHETCDGCAMFVDNICQLDVSICPDCFEHSMWTSAKEAEAKKNELREELMNFLDFYNPASTAKEYHVKEYLETRK